MENNSDKIYITNNHFVVNGLCNETFLSEIELYELFTTFLMFNKYNKITLYKRIINKKTEFSKTVKLGYATKEDDFNECLIIFNKEYLSIIMDSLRSVGFEISTTKNKIKELK